MLILLPVLSALEVNTQVKAHNHAISAELASTRFQEQNPVPLVRLVSIPLLDRGPA